MSWKSAKIIGENQKYGEASQPPRGDKSFIMSRSQLVEVAVNPSKWKSGVKVDEETKQMTFGSVLDCLATTPEDLAKRFIVHPDTYPATPKRKDEAPEDKPWTRQSKYCKEWEVERTKQGFTVISRELMADAQTAWQQLNETVADLLDCSRKQVLIAANWHDRDTGLVIPFTGLLDLVPAADHPTWGKCLGDIKTARNGDPALWPRVVDDSGYDVQAALYQDLYIAATGEDRNTFFHVVQENTPPFHVTTPLPTMSSEFMEWGRAKYTSALTKYCQCLATDVWPGYPVAGLVFGGMQILGPDGLWSYRQSAGNIGNRLEYRKSEEPADGMITP